MKLFNYLDIEFKTISIDKQENFSIYKEGQLSAIQSILKTQRFFCKWFSLPTFFFKYFLIKAGFRSIPVDPMIAIQAQIDAKNKELKDKQALSLVKDEAPSTA